MTDLNTQKVTRVEVIDDNGRAYVNWNIDNVVSVELQDEEKTLKVFISKKKLEK